MSVQTTYDVAAAAVAGQLADDGAIDAVSACNSSSTGITAGLAVMRSGDRLVRPILASDEPTADPDAIIASGVASASTRQTITGASLNGIIGAAEISPPRNVTLTFGNHADWNENMVVVVKGLDALGRPTEEVFPTIEAGNEVLTGKVHFSFVTAVIISAGTSTNGTLLVGVGASVGPLNRLVRGVALYNSMREPGTFAQYEDLDVLAEGRVWVTAEETVTQGGPVYVRIVAGGGESRGAFRTTPDANDCALLLGARWGSSRTGSGLAVLELL